MASHHARGNSVVSSAIQDQPRNNKSLENNIAESSNTNMSTQQQDITCGVLSTINRLRLWQIFQAKNTAPKEAIGLSSSGTSTEKRTKENDLVPPISHPTPPPYVSSSLVIVLAACCWCVAILATTHFASSSASSPSFLGEDASEEKPTVDIGRLHLDQIFRLFWVLFDQQRSMVFLFLNLAERIIELLTSVIITAAILFCIFSTVIGLIWTSLLRLHRRTSSASFHHNSKTALSHIVQNMISSPVVSNKSRNINLPNEELQHLTIANNHESSSMYYNRVGVFPQKQPVYVGLGNDEDKSSVVEADEEYNPFGMEWTAYPMASVPGRSRHAGLMLDDNTLWIYSGQSPEYTKIDAMHLIHLNTKKVENVEATGVVPRARWGHSALLVTIPGGADIPVTRDSSPILSGHKYVLVYGGEYQDRSLSDEVYLLNIDNFEWSKVQSRGDHPGHSFCHRVGLVSEGQEMLMFGGRADGTSAFTDAIYLLDLKTMNWRGMQTYGQKPSPRAYHTLSIVQNQVFVIGGSNNKYSSDNHLYILDLDSREWREIEPRNGEPWPLGRMNHTAVTIGSRIVLYGDKWGLGEKEQAVWVLDTTTEQWQCHFPKGPKVEPRYGHSATDRKSVV